MGINGATGGWTVSPVVLAINPMSAVTIGATFGGGVSTVAGAEAAAAAPLVRSAVLIEGRRSSVEE